MTVKATCDVCGAEIHGEGVTFNVQGTIYRYCSLYPCSTEGARRLNEMALERTRPRNFGLPERGP